MLENIKSIYFIQRIFSYIEEKQKLKVIKRNKHLQKNLNISINNYKRFSGRYIIYKSKRFGNEYDNETGEFIFEGEYLNGEKNGKGKEYDIETGEIMRRIFKWKKKWKWKRI